MPESCLNLGLDIGSTTSKAVLLDEGGYIVFKQYSRHFGNINKSILDILSTLENSYGNALLQIHITGSAGMGISEKYNIPFVQELISISSYIKNHYPEVKTLIDIGGEDSKIVIFRKDGTFDLRMNGTCAGGTGSFIDQMSTLMNLSIEEIDELAQNANSLFPIASRCGVFAKTDVQNLLVREIPKEDISASIFHSLAIQIKNTLMKGNNLIPKVSFSGGPLTFIPSLRKYLKEVLNIEENEIIKIQNPELLAALGCADIKNGKNLRISIHKLLDAVNKPQKSFSFSTNRIEKLFENEEEYILWLKKKNSLKVKRVELSELDNEPCFLGIDSGSTTTKIVLIDSKERIAFDFYENNNSDPIGTVKKGLKLLYDKIKSLKINIPIISVGVTGYGEDLIKACINADFGIVETFAHYRSAKAFLPNISFILDIGGQDMKAIFVNNGIINKIEINEACSSGCGSFIETFSNSLNYSVDEFSKLACSSLNPYDLGTRCTVFMNSRVKQSYREGIPIADISAGLAYSVINNCLYKVLKIYDKSVLGENIIVQGGTFKNHSVHRALEKILGLEVNSPDIAEYMGAFGVALTVKDLYLKNPIPKKSTFNLNPDDNYFKYNVKTIHCKGCENNCPVNKLIFQNGQYFYTGNRCESIFNNSDKPDKKGFNFYKFKYDTLFNREFKPDTKPLLKIGIPRVLNIYENLPFWVKLFTELGFEVVLSDKSSPELCNLGAGTVMSDNICFPAKLTHGHIINLMNKKVDRIFYPMVTFENKEFSCATNTFNCPIVTGYPDVIKRTINPEKNKNIFFDTINISFKNDNFLYKACLKYFTKFGIEKRKFAKAFVLAKKEQIRYKTILKQKAEEIIALNDSLNKKYIILAGRPYHIDPLINHGIPEMISNFGIDFISEDSIPTDNEDLSDVQVLTQWSYPNRLFASAKWAAKRHNVEYVQINNFGCGPDTITIDEVNEILYKHNKSNTLIRIDELSSIGSLKLRLRSLIESIKLKEVQDRNSKLNTRKESKPFSIEDKNRVILAPFFSHFHSIFTKAPFASMGFDCEILPPSDKESIELGLKYVNNEICYPATIVIGDILKALKSGKYDLSKTAVSITQTGGQCRASNYLPLLKKALVKNGFENIPVVSISLASNILKLNNQPGFKLNRVTFTKQAIIGILFGDALQQMYFSSVAREKNKGDSLKIVQKYCNSALQFVKNSNIKATLNILKNAVDEFNSIKIKNYEPTKIGVVGEVYVKYNPFGNLYIVNELSDKGCEIVIPPLINMFIQWFVNVHIKHKSYVDNKTFTRIFATMLQKYYDSVYLKFEEVLSQYKFYYRHPSINELAKHANNFTHLINHYYGEGWMIAGDISYFASTGIDNVICFQPFGCLANHIVARAIEKTLKDYYPDLNLVYLDIDSGASEVNIHNRIHLLLNSIN